MHFVVLGENGQLSESLKGVGQALGHSVEALGLARFDLSNPQSAADVLKSVIEAGRRIHNDVCVNPADEPSKLIESGQVSL